MGAPLRRPLPEAGPQLPRLAAAGRLTVALPARAKLNLELEVVGRRDDGYHDIRTTFQSISLHDLVEAAAADETSFSVAGLEVPAGASNLVLRALQAAERAAGRALPTRLKLTKRIPPGAGFGGGSSDAAATLAALKSLHSLEIDIEPIAEQLGADVPYFLRGGTAFGTGRGDRVQPDRERFGWFALCWAGFEVSTQAVYEAWDATEPSNLFEAAAAAEPRLLEFAARLGDGWRMTGTGSGFFLPVPDGHAAKDAVAGLDCWTAVAHTVPAWG